MSGWARAREAVLDLEGGVERRWLWTRLGWIDVRQRYLGSLLGSFWITANIALMVAGITLIFAHPLGAHWSDFAPFVAIGLVLWQFVQTGLNESSLLFVSAGESIRSAPMPLSVHAFRLVCRNLIVLAHNGLFIALILILFRVVPTASVWSVAPALALAAFSLFWAGLLLGLLGARYRDVSQIVSNALQLLFFLTPIFWMPDVVGPRLQGVAEANPLFAFIDIIRAPLIGAATRPASWEIAIATAALLALAGFTALAAMRRRLPYWV